MKSKLILNLIIILTLLSCDYATEQQGIVLDKKTGKPIVGATVELLDAKDYQKTNTEGYFYVTYVSGRSLPANKIMITKKGYKPLLFEIDKSDEYNIFKVKSETKYIKFDKRFYYTPNDSSSFSEGIDIEQWSTEFLVGDTLKFYLSKDEEKKRNRGVKI